MAGALTIDTLNNSAGVFATENAFKGIAKAWVTFTGSTGAINSSFNVSSVTHTSTGAYTVNLTTSMPAATYCPVITCSNNAGTGSIFGNTTGSTNSVSSYALNTQVSTTAAAQDPYLVYTAVFSA